MTPEQLAFNKALEEAIGVCRLSQSDCFCGALPNGVPCHTCLEMARVIGTLQAKKHPYPCGRAGYCGQSERGEPHTHLPEDI